MSLSASTRSETTKLLTTAMWWILAIVLVAYVGLTAAGLGFVFSASAAGELPGRQNAPMPVGDAAPLLYSIAASIGYVFPLLIGTLMVTAEFRHHTLTPTFLATPRRGLVLWSKTIVGVGIGVVYAVLALIAAVGPSAGFLAGFGQPTALDDSDTWAMLGRIVIAFALWVLVGIGVGTLVRNQVAAVVIVLAFTQFVEPIARVAGMFVDGLDSVLRFLPGAASDALVGTSIYTATTPGSSGADQLDWWVGGVVLLAYAVVLLVLGHLTSWRRDVD
ncbi:ABC transporter permease [Microbacterium protaetiae]|uniref:ABC transporter permease n=1 Tax=Microbacterium protaetiae TaxID=2509458 RepID=A0A4P6EDR9_9MICO|nr:ABC transporter permease [Microbacterium protaetiae]QAY59219.1 ABC transporter permease [Microbacterium protaetiae]